MNQSDRWLKLLNSLNLNPSSHFLSTVSTSHCCYRINTGIVCIRFQQFRGFTVFPYFPHKSVIICPYHGHYFSTKCHQDRAVEAQGQSYFCIYNMSEVWQTGSVRFQQFHQQINNNFSNPFYNDHLPQSKCRYQER